MATMGLDGKIIPDQFKQPPLGNIGNITVFPRPTNPDYGKLEQLKKVLGKQRPFVTGSAATPIEQRPMVPVTPPPIQKKPIQTFPPKINPVIGEPDLKKGGPAVPPKQMFPQYDFATTQKNKLTNYLSR